MSRIYTDPVCALEYEKRAQSAAERKHALYKYLSLCSPKLVGVVAVLYLAHAVNLNSARSFSSLNLRGAEGERLVKPMFLCYLMSVAKLLCAPWANIHTVREYFGVPHQLPKSRYCLIAASDMVALYFGFLSLLFIPPSGSWVLVEAGILVITAFGSAYITKKSKMTRYFAGCIAGALVGLCATTLSLSLSESSLEKSVEQDFHHAEQGNEIVLFGMHVKGELWLWGILFSTGNAVGTATECLLGELGFVDDGLDPWSLNVIIGLIQGSCWIILLIFAQILPGSDNGSVESTVDLIVSARRYPIIAGLVLLVLFGAFGRTAIMWWLRHQYGMIPANMIGSGRVVGLWVFGMFLGLMYPGLGESWSWAGSPVLLLGFAFTLGR